MDVLFSVSDAIETAMHDSSAVSDGLRRKFANRNRLQVYVAVNTWLLSLADMGTPVGLLLAVRKVLLANGLVSVVGACQGIAEMLLEGLAVDQLPDERQFQAELATGDATERLFGVICDSIAHDPARTSEEKAATLLQTLLYLERFTYIGETAATEASMKKFLSANERCRSIEYDWSLRPGYYIMTMMREEFREMLKEKDWPGVDPYAGSLSNGSYVEAMRTKIDPPLPKEGVKSPLIKWARMATYLPTYKGIPLYPLPGGRNFPRVFDEPVMTLVPKSFNAFRVIFPEDLCMNYDAHAILESFRRMLNKNGLIRFINEEDQSVNRDFAHIGSVTGEWATIDMSSASDTISKGMASELLPAWFLRKVLMPVVSRYCSYERQGRVNRKKLFTLLTSGNPMTWLFESVWFLAAGRVACRLCRVNPYTSVFVYGDDLVVKSTVYEALCDLLGCLGHTVNKRKSYGSGWFRESCGGWYYRGTDVTPTFWPRAEVENRVSMALPHLVDLQHKAIERGFESVSDFLVATIDPLQPDMTRSSIGSNHSDIWDASYDGYMDNEMEHLRLVSVKENILNYRMFARLLDEKGKLAADIDLDEFAQHLAYYMYLEHGPMYNSYLDKVLGTSTSRYKSLLEIDTGKTEYRLS